MLQTLFFELLQVAIGNKDSLSSIPSDMEWEELRRMARKQSLSGVCMAGIERLPLNQTPGRRELCQWTASAQKIKIQNEKMNKGCCSIVANFEKLGFWACILKGQSNLLYYPEWLKDKRHSGDIDVWVKPMNESEENPVRKVIECCQSIVKGDYVYYHHLDFPVFKKYNVDVEVHYRPTWMFAPWRNAQWLKFERGCTNRGALPDELNTLGYRVASTEFNIVYQLLHIYKHLFEEGIGLRQILDYYFLLIYYMEHSTEEQRKVTIDWMRRIGVYKFLGAVMYVLQNVFSLPGKYLLCPVLQKEGSFLLSEIMLAGNFGKYDERIGHGLKGVNYAFMKLKRNLRFLTSYPEEVLCEPFFRVYHFLWRCCNT